MLSILPCKDKERLAAYPEGTTLLVYKEDGLECGYIAYKPYKSAMEILEVKVGKGKGKTQFLRADALFRSVGSVALNEGIITLCTKDTSMLSVLEELGFFKNGEFYILYLNKFFGGVCKGCNGSCRSEQK